MLKTSFGDQESRSAGDQESPRRYKVAIVGGGISGLYAAMKIKEKWAVGHEEGGEIVVLERENQWGGRLASDTIIYKNQRIMVEEGAMRFSKSNMPALSGLLEELQIEDDELLPFSMGNVGEPNCNYIRSQNFASDDEDFKRALFKLKSDESSDYFPLISKMYGRLLEHNTPLIMDRYGPETGHVILKNENREKLVEVLDAQFWTTFRKEFTWKVENEEVPLYKFSLPSLILAMGYSLNSLEMVESSCGFLTMFKPVMAAGGLIQHTIAFGLVVPDMFQFRNGADILWKRILEKLRVTPGVSLWKACGVKTLVEHETNEFTLELDTGKKITAEKVVLAVPTSCVKKLYPTWLMGDAAALRRMEKLCNSVITVISTKVTIYFESDWWNEGRAYRMFGANVTDLPCAFLYPFYGERTDGSKGKCIAAMKIYTDDERAEYWESLQLLGKPFSSPLQEKYPLITPGSTVVVEEALRQFSKVFNMEVGTPILTSYRRWNDAVHMNRINTPYHSFPVEQPFTDRKVFLCNESWSDYQHWVEGSLRSADNAVNLLCAHDTAT